MKKYYILTIVFALLIFGCSKKDVDVKESVSYENIQPLDVSSSPSPKKNRIGKYNENRYPKYAEENIRGEFGKGIPIIVPNKFHQVVRVIDKFAIMAKRVLEPGANLEKMQWEANSVVQKAGFTDLNDYVENFIILSEAFGTYEKIKMLDSMIVGGADAKRIELYEAKVYKRLQEQRLTKNDLNFLHKNKEKFARAMQVMDTFAHNMMKENF